MQLGEDFIRTLEKGRVLNLNPVHLVDHGAFAVGLGRPYWVRSRHFFLCCEVGELYSLWVPLFSRQNKTRIPIPLDGRSGHPSWVDGIFFYHPRQVWCVEHLALAKCSPDYSVMQGIENTLAARNLPFLKGDIYAKLAQAGVLQTLPLSDLVEPTPSSA